MDESYLYFMAKNDISIKDLFKAYWTDWVTFIVVAALCGVLELVPPFQRYYFQNDESIMYPLKPETVPTWMLFVIAIILPMAIMLIISFTYRRTKYDIHHMMLSFLLTIAFTVLITSSIKLAVGRLRPNFIARCQPASNDDNAQCKGDPSTVAEGRKSFPSGHSSTAFAGLGFLSIYLAGKMRAFDGRGYIFRMGILLIPLLGAALIAISRVDDYYHHWQDVTVGAILGLSLAYLTYRQYYPSLRSPRAGNPSLVRITGVEKMPLSPSPNSISDNNSNKEETSIEMV